MPEMTYQQLKAATIQLTKRIIRDSESIRRWGQHIDNEATETRRIGDQIGAKRVDPDTVAETQELAKIMEGVSEAAIAYATSGQDAAAASKAAHGQAQASHGGISEAVNRSSARNIHDVDRTWLEQE